MHGVGLGWEGEAGITPWFFSLGGWGWVGGAGIIDCLSNSYDVQEVPFSFRTARHPFNYGPKLGRESCLQEDHIGRILKKFVLADVFSKMDDRPSCKVISENIAKFTLL